MRSRSGNTLPALMLSLPLVAIPLMAVFGVPQFVPVIASSVSEEQQHERTVTRRSSGVGESAAPNSNLVANSSRGIDGLSDERLNDIFRPKSLKRPESRPARVSKSEQSEAFESRASLTATSSDIPLTQLQKNNLSDLFGSDQGTPDFVDLRSSDRMTTFPKRTQDPSMLATVAMTEAESQAFASNVSTKDGLTWRRAVQRLNELGIHQFRLEPGRVPGEFYFACEYSQDQDSRITRRFEAEGSEPLRAVELVLRQIDEWSHRR